MATMSAAWSAAREGVAMIERDDRAFVRVYGRDPVKMIHGLVTNDVAAATEERGVYAAMLTPKGKMVSDMRIFRTGDDVLLDVPAAALDAVTGHLRKFVPPLFARFEVVSDRAMLGVYGPRADAVLGNVLGEPVRTTLAEDAVEVRRAGGEDALLVVHTRYTGEAGFDVIGSRATVQALRERMGAEGAVAIDHDTLDVLRIEAGRPRWGAELDENVIPLEAGLQDRAISTTKGCYTGQEVIVRILHRGHVNWLLRGVLLGDAGAPAAGTALLHPESGKKIGRTTSACASPRLGQTIALAFVRRELEPPVDVRLEGDDVPVTVVALPFPNTALGAPEGLDVSS
jgi:folate-binding protein YgfZ